MTISYPRLATTYAAPKAPSHIYHPENIDRLIDVLNAHLDDDTKMTLVMAMPGLQGHLKAGDQGEV
ncbi:MAG: hypothetical protein NVV72_09315 [Asticcacaulis sp.]|nr:hypothetical protein [Asticcacaulis sp.]